MTHFLLRAIIALAVIGSSGLSFSQENPAVLSAEMSGPPMAHPPADEILPTESEPVQEINVPLTVPNPGDDPADSMVPFADLGIEIPPVTVVEDDPAAEHDQEEDLSHIIVEIVQDKPVSVTPMLPRTKFDRLKQLAGQWEGLSQDPGVQKQEKIRVIYQITAGGHAVLETIFPGTSQEMVTLYFEEDGELYLMHFSLLGSRSLMKALSSSPETKPSDEKVLEFLLVETPGLSPTVETHMHSLKIGFVDPNKMTHDWVLYEAGQPSGAYKFNLTRKPN